VNEDLLIGNVPFTHDPWVAARNRYDGMPFRRVGNSGLLLPAISLGLWYNFGDNRPFDTQRAVLRHAFDRGITHFDLANNYGPPYGSAEENFGRMLRSNFKPYRYSHRFDPNTPLEETIGALDTAVRAGKTRYVGISSYSAAHTDEAAAIAKRLGTPLVIHQPSYSMLNRWIEGDLMQQLDSAGMGAIAFTALAQGLLTDRYVEQPVDEVVRATARPTFDDGAVTEAVRGRLQALARIAKQRG
jgi:L-glyceraldehyde 3-phosphate reductase